MNIISSIRKSGCNLAIFITNMKRKKEKKGIFPLLLGIRGLLEKYPTFGREKETGLPGALDT